MTNRYSQWRWGGLSGNWSISPAPKISSLKPHHSVKSTSLWSSILQLEQVLPRLLYHKSMKIKLYLDKIITTLHYWLIWFCHICIMGYEFVAVIFNIAYTAFNCSSIYQSIAMRWMSAKKKNKGNQISVNIIFPL